MPKEEKKNHVKLMWIYLLNLEPQEEMNFVYIYLHTELHLYLAEENFCCDSCSKCFFGSCKFYTWKWTHILILGFFWQDCFS